MYPFSVYKIIFHFPLRRFLKHPLFTTILLVWAVTGMRNISDKYHLFNKSTKYQYLYTKNFNLPYLTKILVISIKMFSKHPLFTTFLLLFAVSKVCNIWNKYWLPNKSTNFNIFTQEISHLYFISKSNWFFLTQRFLEASTFNHISTTVV